MYIVDFSDLPRVIRVYDVVDDGTRLANRRAFVTCETDETPDGFRCDIDGNLWCGWGTAPALDGVVVFNPDGKRIGKIALPERAAPTSASAASSAIACSWRRATRSTRSTSTPRACVRAASTGHVRAPESACLTSARVDRNAVSMRASRRTATGRRVCGHPSRRRFAPPQDEVVEIEFSRSKEQQLMNAWRIALTAALAGRAASAAIGAGSHPGPLHGDLAIRDRRGRASDRGAGRHRDAGERRQCDRRRRRRQCRHGRGGADDERHRRRPVRDRL